MPKPSPKRLRVRTCALCRSRPTTSSICRALHRVRDRLVHRRTALINQIRGFLLERGIVFAQGPANLRRQMPLILEDAEQKITPRMRNLLARLWEEWKSLNAEVESISDEIDAIAGQDAA